MLNLKSSSKKLSPEPKKHLETESHHKQLFPEPKKHLETEDIELSELYRTFNENFTEISDKNRKTETISSLFEYFRWKSMLMYGCWCAADDALDETAHVLQLPNKEIDIISHVDIPSFSLFNPFCLACKQGEVRIVSMLLEQGCSPTCFGWNGNTALHLAAYSGNDDVVRILLEDSRVQIDYRNIYGCTPLHLAALKGHSNIVEALLAFRSNPNTQEKNGKIALHFAIEGGHDSLSRVLFQRFEHDKQKGSAIVAAPTTEVPLQLSALKAICFKDLPQKLSAVRFTEAAQAVVNSISLKNVKLILSRHIVQGREFPSYNICEKNGWHVTADQLCLEDKVLFVSHRWENTDLPDNEGREFRILQEFIKQASEFFKYIWLDYACICQDKSSELFQDQLVNIPTVLWLATHCIIIPKVILISQIINPTILVPITHLAEHFERAWCILEGVSCLLTGTQLYCSFQIGDSIIFHKLDPFEGAASDLGFQAAYSTTFNMVLNSNPAAILDVGYHTVQDKWSLSDPSEIVCLLASIHSSKDKHTNIILKKAKAMKLERVDLENCLSADVSRLWNLIGECSFEQDKLLVFKMIVLIACFSLCGRTLPRQPKPDLSILVPDTDTQIIDCSELEQDPEDAEKKKPAQHESCCIVQ